MAGQLDLFLPHAAVLHSLRRDTADRQGCASVAYRQKVCQSVSDPLCCPVPGESSFEIGWQLLFGEITLAQIGKYILGSIYCYANMTWMPNCSPLWFFPCLFISKIVYIALSKRLSERIRLCAILALTMLSYLWYCFELPRMPWNVFPAMMGLLFLWIGEQMSKFRFPHRFSRGQTLGLSTVMVLLLPVVIQNGAKVGMNENTYGNLLIFLIGACGFSALTILLAKRVSHSRALSIFWGQNTIIVIGFNYFIRTFSTELYYWIPFVKRFPIHWISSFVLTILMLAGLIYGKMMTNSSFSDRKGKKQ